MTLPFKGNARVPGALGGIVGRIPGPIGLSLNQSVETSPSSLSSLPPVLLGLLTGMDVEGETILGTYLYGGGIDQDIEDAAWTAYMMRHQSMRKQIFAKLILHVREIAEKKTAGRFPIVERFHAEFPENSGLSGYALLHGSNKDVGDFLLTGWADMHDAVDPAEGAFDIDLDLRFTFNDIVDPNGQYLMDRIRAVAADIVTLGQPRKYRLSIHWGSKCLAEVRPDGSFVFSGYPSDRPLGVRPLPRAKLDWAGAERTRAKDIEAKIIQQLKRVISTDDIPSLADRKQRLLWMFYHLSGYMGSTYLDRFSKPAYDDDLPRLVRERLSSELRKELLDALRGKRPQGEEPA